MYRELAHAVYRRGDTVAGGYDIPPWGWGVFFVDFLVFLPLILVVSPVAISTFRSHALC